MMLGMCVLKRHDDGSIEVVQADPEIQIAGEFIRQPADLDAGVTITFNLPDGRAYKLVNYDALADAFGAVLIEKLPLATGGIANGNGRLIGSARGSVDCVIPMPGMQPAAVQATPPKMPPGMTPRPPAPGNR